MEVFLGKKEKRLITLARFLYEQKGEQISVKKIAKALSISPLMVSEVIYEYRVSQLKGCGLEISIAETGMVDYQIADFSYHKLKQLLIKNDLKFILCKKIFEGKFTTVLNFSEEHYVSIASTYRKIVDLKKILKSYQLELDLSKSPFLKGPEHQIRHFYFELYFSVYGLTEHYLADSQVAPVLSQRLVENTTVPVCQKIKLLFFISVSRMATNNYLTDFNFSKPYQSYAFEEWLKETYYITMSQDKTLKKTASEWQFALMYTLGLNMIEREQLPLIKLNLTQGDQRQLTLTESWITHFSRFFQVELSPQNKFFLYVNLYILFTKLTIFPITVQEALAHEVPDSINTENAHLTSRIATFRKQLAAIDKQLILPESYCHFFIMECLFLTKESLEICLFLNHLSSQSRMIEKEITKRAISQVVFTREITKNTKLIISDLVFDDQNLGRTLAVEKFFIQPIPTANDYKLIAEKMAMLMN